MPTDRDIAAQHDLLEINRGNLRQLLSQQAQYGGQSHAPTDVINSLERTREEIHRIKGVLRGWHELVEDLPDDGDPPMQPALSARHQQIFLSYKRDLDPDEGLAQALRRGLHTTHEVFLDRDLPIGAFWADSIRTKIEHCDALIVLLSARAIESEMVREEIALAHELWQK